MTAAIDIHAKKRVLLIAANPGTSPTTGWPIGFWWAELTHPYWAFTEAGYEVDIVEPQGRRPRGRRLFRPRGRLGLLRPRPHLARLQEIAHPRCAAQGQPRHRDVDLADYDAIFVAGGQSPMVTMIDDTALHAFVARAYEAGKIVAVVCHGTCVLLKTASRTATSS